MASPLPIQLGFSSEEIEKKTRVSKALLRGATHLGECHPSIGHLARSVLFGNSRCIAGILGYVHPFFAQGTIHPSTSDGLNSIIRRLPFLGIEPVSSDELATNLLIGSAAIIGGPVANAHARLIFGNARKSPLLGAPLPITFDLSEFAQALSHRQERWRLVVEGNVISSPSECLILTTLPMDEADRIVSIAGLHGAGTRAIDFVLQDGNLLENLARQTRFLDGWQALIEVNAADHENPQSLGTLRVFPIKADFGNEKYSYRSRMLMTNEQLLEIYNLFPNAPFVNASEFTSKSSSHRLGLFPPEKAISSRFQRVNMRALRDALADVIEYVQRTKSAMVLTRHARDAAAVISIADLWKIQFLDDLGVSQQLDGCATVEEGKAVLKGHLFNTVTEGSDINNPVEVEEMGRSADILSIPMKPLGHVGYPMPKRR